MASKGDALIAYRVCEFCVASLLPALPLLFLLVGLVGL